jgi:plastocyanin
MTMNARTRILALLLTGAVAVSSCSDGITVASMRRPDSGAVSIAASRFDPRQATVAPGGTITFVNTDPFAHTVTAAEGTTVPFDSGDLGQDAMFVMSFADPGTYDYFCTIHPTMTATVVVE